MFSIVRRLNRLKASGVLGINARNSAYALRYNPRKQYPLVDDKLRTKRLASAHGIPVPTLYNRIRYEHEIKRLDKLLEPYSDFVIKPAHGAGGDGILVITNRVFGHYRQVNGALLATDDLSYHLSCLLAGAYSLGGHPDEALIEKRVIVDNAFESISYEGVPDIRVVTLLGYPAMAMLRLPTRASSGKANLHQGALGVGICLSTGKTLGGVLHHESLDYHPDTLHKTRDFQVPYWDEILMMAASAYELTGLGYLGVDIVLDKIEGPLMLELNARPGLSIQIANRCGLQKRYDAIEREARQRELQHKSQTIADRVLFSKMLDGDAAPESATAPVLHAYG